MIEVWKELLVLKMLTKVSLALMPALLAFCAVALETTVRSWATGRGAALPLILLLIGTSLLHPHLRSQIIAALCYGVAFLAIRDTFSDHQWHLPFAMDRDLAETVIFSALLLVAALSIVAAIAETLAPGTVWARRCYFGAAALYFSGLGINYYGPHGSWQAVVLCVTGVTAAIGCIFAHRIVASEWVEEIDPEITDEAEQRLRDAEHLRTLRDKEWQDPAAPPSNSGNVSQVS
jgi:hypothetical protein